MLRTIRDVLGDKGKVGLLTYVALTEIASDHKSDTFKVSHSEIALRGRISPASVKRILPIFQKMGLIRVQPNYINGIQTASTYTLVRGCPLAHSELPLAQIVKRK